MATLFNLSPIKRISFCCILLVSSFTFSQVGIGNTDPKASLDITASNQATPANTDGILIPRVDLFPGTPPVANQQGMLIYVTGLGTGANPPAEGFYYWDSANWIPFVKRINDLYDGKSDLDGSDDGASVFLGINAGAGDDSDNRKNVGVGFQTLQANTAGENNTALGYRALNANTSVRNTAIGYNSLVLNTTGRNNTAIGGQSMTSNETGDSNVSIGAFSMAKNTVGSNNVAIGNQTLRFNSFGENNTTIGDYAGRSIDIDNTSDLDNDKNVYIGGKAGDSDFNASNNVYIGFQAGAGNYIPANDTDPASGTLESKSGNVFIGYQAGYDETTNNKLYIENSASTTPLIYGDFNNDEVEINGTLKVAEQNVFKVGKFTAVEAAAITPQNGDMIYVTNTGGVFTTRGFWGRESGAWVKL